VHTSTGCISIVYVNVTDVPTENPTKRGTNQNNQTSQLDDNQDKQEILKKAMFVLSAIRVKVRHQGSMTPTRHQRGIFNHSHGLLGCLCRSKLKENEGRFKTGRIGTKKNFRASPLHLACLKERSVTVQNFRTSRQTNSPDASGLFPIHLAAAVDRATDVLRWKKICKDRLRQITTQSRVPLTMKIVASRPSTSAARVSTPAPTIRFAQ
jgi:hypothetical protein